MIELGNIALLFYIPFRSFTCFNASENVCLFYNTFSYRDSEVTAKGELGDRQTNKEDKDKPPPPPDHSIKGIENQS